MSGPISPEVPVEAVNRRRSDLDPRADWEDEQVVDADFSGQSADGLWLTRCELRGVRFTAAQLKRLSLTDVVAVDCEFSGAVLHDPSFLRVEFRNCRMAGLVLVNGKFRHVRLIDCKLDESNLRFVDAEHVVWEGCSLAGADFMEASLAKTRFDGCDLRAASFAKASMRGVRLGGSRIDGIVGAGSMAGVVVSSDQVLPLALSLLGEFDIEISDDPE